MKNGRPARRNWRSYSSRVGMCGPILAYAPAVSWEPAVGMVGSSWVVDGVEVLAQRGGLEKYRRSGSTFGIPLLYPWANRLDREIDSPLVRLDPHGLPIHGILAASPHWRVVGDDPLTARLDFGAHPEYLAVFPYPH